MHRANVVVSSISRIPLHSIARSRRQSLAVACGCHQHQHHTLQLRVAPLTPTPTPSASRRSISFIALPLLPINTSQQHQHLILQRGSILSMRSLTTEPPNNDTTNQSSMKRLGTKVFIATATASASLAAYYCATAIFFSSVGTVNGDITTTSNANYHLEKKRDDNYGIEYVGFDSYPGVHLDDGTGVATKEVTASSVVAVSRALKAAGLDETTGMISGITVGQGEQDSLHPNHAHRIGLGTTCPVYGCPLLPLDVHYNEDVKAQLTNLRKETSLEDEMKVLLTSAGSDNAATLTLIGYKGGRVDQQINQDRALALAPYSYRNINSSSADGKGNDDSSTPYKVGILIGAFDGHAKFGERVSEYVVKTLPALLGSKLVEYEAMVSNGSQEIDQQKRDLDISQILRETFLELDATSPAAPSGGCTASVVLQLGTKIYVANAGDSRSFIAVHIKSPLQSTNGDNDDKQTITKIVFGTREDKPHIPTERDRVEHMGGTVFLPNGFLTTGKGTTRVLYQDPTTGSTSGLAMSRSIGDWDAGEVGVIPDPLIDILDVTEIKRKILGSLNGTCNDKEAVEIDPATGESRSTGQCVTYSEEDVRIFAVSATDGLLDYLPEQNIVNHVAKGLYGSTGNKGESTEEQTASHPLLACEDLIFAAAQGWQEDKGGRYRDDIAIAIADLEV